MSTEQPPRPFRAPRPVADLIGDVMRPSVRKRGFATVDLVQHWSDIVGAAYADSTRPERLTWPRKMGEGGEDQFEPATLTVRCDGAKALLFQHDAPEIARRINAVFGYAAVGRVRILQAPVGSARPPRQPPPRPLTKAESERLAEDLSGIADAGLRAALERLGRAVRGSRSVEDKGR
jgi:hypothetical protein